MGNFILVSRQNAMAGRWHECWRYYGKEVSHLGMAAYSRRGVPISKYWDGAGCELNF